MIMTILLTVSLLTLRADIPVYASRGNIFNKAFKEPFESIYFVFYNGDWLRLTTHYGPSTFIDAYYILNFLKKEKRNLEDVAIIIHNHFARPILSDGNRIAMKRLKGMGFRGSFCIYVTGTKKVNCEWCGEDR